MSDWEREGFVSIWVGTLPNEDDLRSYLREQYEDDDAPISEFAAACGLDWYDHDFVESRFTDHVDLRDLLLPFSYATSFVDLAVEEGSRKGVFQANCAVVVFNCDHSGSDGEHCRLKFLGSFKFEQI